MIRPSINPQSNAQDDELSEMLRVQFDLQEMNAFFGGFAEEMVPDYFRTRTVRRADNPKQIDLWKDYRAA